MEPRHPLAACEECPLFDPACRYVPTTFAENAKLVVVGEAPGFQEAMYGKPFMGPSGQLIKKVLKHHGYSPQEVVFTNVCACRPPDNATPAKAAINSCRGRLMDDIARSGASAVLALGGTATNALIDDNRTISALRVGPAKAPTRGLDGSAVESVVPTWHPAYCLRNADAFPTMVADVGKLRESSHASWTEPRYRVLDDAASAHEGIAWLAANADVLVVDIEVGVDKDESFFHPNEFDLLCVGLAYADGRAMVVGENALADGSVRDALRSLLQTCKLVAHNGKFDLAGLQPTLGILELYFDTMLASYCLDERPGGHGLKVLAVEKLGAPKYDDEIKQYIPKGDKNYANIPRPILYKYNAYDVACTWALYEMFNQALARPVRFWPYPDRRVRTLRDVHDMLVAASNQLMFLELNGIAVDLPYNFQLTSTYQETLSVIEERLNDIVSVATGGAVPSINPRSPIQIRKFLETQRINVASTNVATLEALQSRLALGSHAWEFVSELLVHRRQQKLFSTYVVGLTKRVYRGRVYTTYMLHGTTSGRLASRNPNLQNVVRDKNIRRQFVASSPSNVLVQADYKQAELRVMTTLGKDEYFRQILSDPTADLFTELVCQLYHIDRAQALDGSARAKEMRIRVKAFVYGLGYGREVASIAAEFKIPLRDAQKLRDDFFSLIPGIAKWQTEIRNTVHRTGELVTPFGRHRRFHLITDQNRRDVENEALSYLPQSTASDICLSALVQVRPMLKGLGWVRLTIHDAITVECPRDRVEQVSQILVEQMESAGRAFTSYVPFYVDVSTGDSWGNL